MSKSPVIGATIVAIRKMTAAELKAEGWESKRTVTAIVLSNGDVLYPSRDSEGNGPGEIFGINKNSAFVLNPEVE